MIGLTIGLGFQNPTYACRQQAKNWTIEICQFFRAKNFYTGAHCKGNSYFDSAVCTLLVGPSEFVQTMNRCAQSIFVVVLF